MEEEDEGFKDDVVDMSFAENLSMLLQPGAAPATSDTARKPEEKEEEDFVSLLKSVVDDNHVCVKKTLTLLLCLLQDVCGPDGHGRYQHVVHLAHAKAQAASPRLHDTAAGEGDSRTMAEPVM